MNQRLVKQVSSVLWPAFMVAAAAELVFCGLIDPLDLQVFEGLADGERTSVYSLSFMFFWVVGITTAMLSELLHKPASEINHAPPAQRREPSREMTRQQHALHH